LNIIARLSYATLAFVIGFSASSFVLGEVRAAESKAVVLTAEELAEKESRKACKIQICDIFRSRKTSGEQIACPIIKTWREEAIKDMVTGGKIGWRWGKVFCEFNLRLAQADLAKVVNEPSYELRVPTHTINCKVDRKKDGKMHKISVGIAPVVKFKNGKAIEAHMNWGKVEAPILFKSLIWPGVKLDNKVNVIGGKMVKMVNGFMTKKCDQVASELPSAQK
jgi:hypothetical protein